MPMLLATCPSPAVPLLEPHAAELGGLITQLTEALQALAAMVAGSVTLARCAEQSCHAAQAVWQGRGPAACMPPVAACTAGQP